MKFSVSKDKLLEGLQAVQNVVSTRTTLPILSNVLIRAENGALHFTTNDLDVGMSCSVEAKIEKPGGTTIPARRLAGIVKEQFIKKVERKNNWFFSNFKIQLMYKQFIFEIVLAKKTRLLDAKLRRCSEIKYHKLKENELHGLLNHITFQPHKK